MLTSNDNDDVLDQVHISRWTKESDKQTNNQGEAGM